MPFLLETCCKTCFSMFLSPPYPHHIPILSPSYPLPTLTISHRPPELSSPLPDHPAPSRTILPLSDPPAPSPNPLVFVSLSGKSQSFIFQEMLQLSSAVSS